ncbi:MAG: GtrA family protein [Lachnospiraceae bacterium]|nr:GtrA family protein [Lachnospiraceae bacterium]MDY5741403.1 GtrA family protein [Lachnospiraceae bacterium]
MRVDFRGLWNQYKDAIPYIFFGICTTAVNVIMYWLFAHTLGQGVMASTMAAWLLAVLFAYVTNRKWVFHSMAETGDEVIKELISFFGCRIATGMLDWTVMFVFVKRLGWNDMIMKFIANIMVIVLNYAASKFFIFKRKKK